MRIDYFRPAEDFQKDMDDMIRRLQLEQSEARTGSTSMAKEFELEEKYRKEGIPLYFKVYDP
jgi:hypothetical protein